MAKRDFLSEAKDHVIANTGFLAAGDIRDLDKAVKRGEIAKWRGYWFPEAGAPIGLGPLKTCYGPKAVCARFQSFVASAA